MGQVRNPEFAAQIAGMIVVAINGTLPKQQPEVNPVMGLLTQMIMTVILELFFPGLVKLPCYNIIVKQCDCNRPGTRWKRRT